jgi:uncharacterized protein YecE (DUF72 family)
VSAQTGARANTWVRPYRIKMSTKYFIGTSGWHYEHWRGRFYPVDLPKSKWLEFYARSFSTVELNNSFYHLPSEKAFANWRDSSPEGFVYAVKVSRFITHIKKLRNIEEALEKFLERAKLLEGKLGPLLYQLPPNMHRNDVVLEAFLSILPRELNHVFEFRHESWLDKGVFDLLRRYNVGFCIYDMPDFTTPLEATVDFVYVRFHGSAWLYGGSYSDEELNKWAKNIMGLARNAKAVYIYFNNDAEAFAVQNALTLAQKLK